MNQIDLSDSNYKIAEDLVQAIFSSPDPRQSAINLIHDLIDHPFLHDEMHDELILAAAASLNLSILPEKE